jgi:hypothetical protein
MDKILKQKHISYILPSIFLFWRTCNLRLMKTSPFSKWQDWAAELGVSIRRRGTVSRLSQFLLWHGIVLKWRDEYWSITISLHWCVTSTTVSQYYSKGVTFMTGLCVCIPLQNKCLLSSMCLCTKPLYVIKYYRIKGCPLCMENIHYRRFHKIAFFKATQGLHPSPPPHTYLGSAVRVAKLYDFAVTLKHAIWWRKPWSFWTVQPIRLSLKQWLPFSMDRQKLPKQVSPVTLSDLENIALIIWFLALKRIIEFASCILSHTCGMRF